MGINLKKLSAFSTLAMLIWVPKAGSFLLSVANPPIKQYTIQTAEANQILPLIYIQNMEYYNNTITAAYTPYITQHLSLDPNIIITDNEDLADYDLKPKLLQSKIEPINDENSKYSMSVVVELWAKGGTKVASEQKNRYIIINNSEDSQQIARQLLIKLLKEALDSLCNKLKNNHLEIS